MPLLAPREGDSDGGYAVRDYRAVDPRLGTMDDLERLCGLARGRGISVCVDLVLNHCAAEHAWAVAARAGDPEAQAMFWMFGDRELPDAYERTLPEVFPDFAPGNFSYLPETGTWVWTSFNTFQWDLNWSNPRVFAEMADVLLNLANRGVEVLRLDAVGFIWKRLGTNCQNQPEVHDLLQALRACARIVAPSVVFKAEAIVSPVDLAAYLGVGRHHGRISDLAYHNSLMVQYWSAVATRDARLATLVLGRLPAKPASTAWATYLRCHDDIGWAVLDEDAAALGWSGFAHRRFLADFYAGKFPGSFARGEVFQDNPVTGDRRTSGTMASLAGLEDALAAGDDTLVDLRHPPDPARPRPDLRLRRHPAALHGRRARPAQRPQLPRRPGPGGRQPLAAPPGDGLGAGPAPHRAGHGQQRIFSALVALAEARRRTPQLHAATPVEVVDLQQPQLFAFMRRHPLGTLLAVHNVTEQPQQVSPMALYLVGHDQPVDQITGQPARVDHGQVVLDPYQAVWLTAPGV